MITDKQYIILIFIFGIIMLIQALLFIKIEHKVLASICIILSMIFIAITIYLYRIYSYSNILFHTSSALKFRTEPLSVLFFISLTIIVINSIIFVIFFIISNNNTVITEEQQEEEQEQQPQEQEPEEEEQEQEEEKQEQQQQKNEQNDLPHKEQFFIEFLNHHNIFQLAHVFITFPQKPYEPFVTLRKLSELFVDTINNDHKLAIMQTIQTEVDKNDKVNEKTIKDIFQFFCGMVTDGVHATINKNTDAVFQAFLDVYNVKSKFDFYVMIISIYVATRPIISKSGYLYVYVTKKNKNKPFAAVRYGKNISFELMLKQYLLVTFVQIDYFSKISQCLERIWPGSPQEDKTTIINQIYTNMIVPDEYLNDSLGPEENA